MSNTDTKPVLASLRGRDPQWVPADHPDRLIYSKTVADITQDAIDKGFLPDGGVLTERQIEEIQYKLDRYGLDRFDEEVYDALYAVLGEPQYDEEG